MGNCCTPQLTKDEQHPNKRLKVSDNNNDARSTALNSINSTELRQRYTKLLYEKQKVIIKNQQEKQQKQRQLTELQAQGKRIQCDKLKRQIDTHVKLINQAKAQQNKIQQKIDQF